MPQLFKQLRNCINFTLKSSSLINVKPGKKLDQLHEYLKRFADKCGEFFLIFRPRMVSFIILKTVTSPVMHSVVSTGPHFVAKVVS